MSDYVVDASVIVQHFVPDQFTANADALFETLNTGVQFHVPEFCLLECTNVVWKQVRFNNLTLEEAETLVSDLIATPFVIQAATVMLPRALQIGLAHQLAVYDSVYIALAEKLKLPLMTVDQRQSSAALNVGVPLKPLTDFT
jgi:predicted nucleic acid-binding protein